MDKCEIPNKKNCSLHEKKIHNFYPFLIFSFRLYCFLCVCFFSSLLHYIRGHDVTTVDSVGVSLFLLDALSCEHSLHLYFGANHRMLRKNRIFNMNKIQIKQKKRNIYIKYFLVIECGRESAHIHNPHFEIFISLYRNFCFCFSLFLVS